MYVDGGLILNYPVKLFDRLKYIAPEEVSYAARPTEYYAIGNTSFLAERPGRSPYVYNRQTLGLRLDTREQIGLYRYDEPPRGRGVGNLVEYAKALTGALRAVQENQHLHGDDWNRSIYIDTLDVGTTDFDLPESKKDALVAQGERGVASYFAWFDDPAATPENRIRPLPAGDGPVRMEIATPL